MIEEPFAGGVELFEDVLHETVLTVHAHLAVVLPAALELGISLGIHARDAVMEVAPFGRVQGMHESVFGMRPLLDPLPADGVGRGAAIDARGRIVIRIAGHGLAAAVEKELIEVELAFLHSRHEGRLDARRPANRERVPRCPGIGPLQIQSPPAADHGGFAGGGLKDHRPGRRAGILRFQQQGLGQIIGAAAENDPERLRGLLRPPPHVASPREGCQGRLPGAGVLVVAVGGHVDFGRQARRTGKGKSCQQKDRAEIIGKGNVAWQASFGAWGLKADGLASCRPSIVMSRRTG